MTTQGQDKQASDLWGNDPSKWFLGVFYYNKDDKRIFPPKKLPLTGVTINFANPYSILLFVGIIGLLLLIYFAAS